MQWHNTRERWGAIAQLLHWAIALAVFSLLGLGWAGLGHGGLANLTHQVRALLAA